MTDEINPDQQDYYARRAAEYDGIYLKPERQPDLRRLEAWLPGELAHRHILEVAGGTGYWSQFIAPTAASLVITDGALETLAIARDRVRGRVTFVQADAYALPAALGQFDAAFAGFWFSHIPLGRRREFLTGLHARLLPDSPVVFIDNRYVPGSSTPIAERDAEGNTWQVRRLDDGSQHRVLKNFPQAAELHELIAGCGEGGVFREYDYYWTFRYRTPGI